MSVVVPLYFDGELLPNPFPC